MIAPDVPGRAWTEPRAEQAVMALVAAMIDEFAIDTRRIVVVGSAWAVPGPGICLLPSPGSVHGGNRHGWTH